MGAFVLITMPAASPAAAEIQSKLVAAIRQIAELDEKVEDIERKSKEMSADVERRSRQTFYLERNLDTRERETADLNRQMFMLVGKSDPDEFSSLRDDQDSEMDRLIRKKDMLNAELGEKRAQEKAMY